MWPVMYLLGDWYFFMTWLVKHCPIDLDRSVTQVFRTRNAGVARSLDILCVIIYYGS